MRLVRAVPILLSLLVLAAARPARAAWHALEEIPVESPVYRLLDDVASNYPLSKGLLLTRPWTRADLGRFLDQLVSDTPAAANDPAVQRLRRELEPGGGFDGLEPALSTEEADASFELSPYARLGYAEDKARSAVVRDDRAGLQASLAFGEHALLYLDGYAGTTSPGPRGTPDANGSYRSTSSDVVAWYDRAYATWATRGFLVRGGHTMLRWGPGLNGTMAQSDGAPAFDLLEARAALPGGAQLAWFVGSLDPAGETYLAGHRLEFRTGRSVQLSLSELARFNGAANAPIYLLPVLPFALMDRRVRGASQQPSDSLAKLAGNNVMYAGDFSWTWRPGIRIYGEVAVDDATLHNTRPLAMAWQLGAHLRRLVRGHAWSLRGEYARVYPYTYSVDSGLDFSHAGFSTAFPLGPDVDLLSGRLEYRFDAAWTFGLEGSDARKGANQLGQAWQPGQPVPSTLVLTFPVEQDQRVALTADWSPSPSVSLSVAGGSARVTGLGHVPGVDTSGRFASARATLRW
jgi:hypothetical protein